MYSASEYLASDERRYIKSRIRYDTICTLSKSVSPYSGYSAAWSTLEEGQYKIHVQLYCIASNAVVLYQIIVLWFKIVNLYYMKHMFFFICED